MRYSSRLTRSLTAPLAALLLAALTAGTAHAAARPHANWVCGSAASGAAGCQPAAGSNAVRPYTGDCERSGVTCRPPLSGSCTGFSSQTTPPATIRVYVPGDSQNPIHTVDFRTYVQNVLPDEWVASWDGDALKAGAIAVKSYAWYWTTHFGGYLNGDSRQCFDVTDDQDFQVYRAGSAVARTSAVVDETWPFAARTAGGSILQTSYRAYLNSPSEACGAYADGTTLSQYGTQACNEASTGNKWNVILQKYYSGIQLATAQQLRTPYDFSYEQTSSRATFLRGHWAIDDGYPTSFNFGLAGDLPVITDSGDGFAHAGVFRPSNGSWYLASPTGTLASVTQWGLPGDIPVPGHWNGLGQPSTLAVYRPSNETWYIRGRAPVQWGLRGDIPVPGDYNGDGTTEIAVFRPSNGTWYLPGRPTVQWALPGDEPVPGDYNGDGSTDIAV
ncbi:MAG TPA: SpoIID/LytB domain-containing protein, partial [Jatrophihabitans sp.]|nr:SpoIID/LytB domain-containing protein [Jatrophihabitans sp.]